MNKNFDQKLLPLMLKALADDSRLAILLMLNLHECAVNELAQATKLTDPTISHHLARLREAGLVSLRMAGNQRFYRVNEEGLALFKQLANEIELTPPDPGLNVSDDRWIAELGWDAQDQQVLKEHTHNGKVTSLPNKLKKTVVVLRWVATLFEPGKVYTEPEVNAILKEVYAWDYVSLRRDLIAMGYLEREPGGAKYWLAVEEK
jgi:DNA-binding HxlR family transcriptional regulator